MIQISASFADVFVVPDRNCGMSKSERTEGEKRRSDGRDEKMLKMTRSGWDARRREGERGKK